MSISKGLSGGLVIWLSVQAWAMPPGAGLAIEPAPSISRAALDDALPPFAPGLEQPAATATTRTYPSGSAPCNTTLQACISGSFDGDTITIAANTYLTGSLSITRGVSLVGTGATPADVKLRPSSGRMILYSGVPLTATFVLSNVMIENGDAGGSTGGGVRVNSGSAVPLFFNLIISNSVSIAGGGIRLSSTEPATMTNVALISNTASVGDGGGMSAAGNLTMINSRIERNKAVASGGGLDVAGALILINTTVQTNTAPGQDGGGARATGFVTLVSSVIQSNTAGSAGGGVLAAGGASISGSTLLRNIAGVGGGLFVTGSLALTDTKLFSNRATVSNGGAIAAMGATTVTLVGATRSGALESNIAALAGGGLYAPGRTVHLIGGVSVSVNSAISGIGGGLVAHDVLFSDGDFIRHAIFYANSSGSDGGGIYAAGSVDIADWSEFDTNHANGSGGGIHALGDVSVASQPVFVFNTADLDGGAISAGGNAYGTSASFIGNTAVGYGGCVVAGDNVTLTQSTFTSCSAGLQGGAILAGDGVIISGGSFISNTAAFGGAIAADDVAQISTAQFLSNTAGSHGGAVYVTGQAIVTGSLFQGNRLTQTSSFGGGLFALDRAWVTNTTFIQNSVGISGDGGGAFFNAVTSAQNVTFTQNAAGEDAGGAWFEEGSFIVDSRFLSNTAGRQGGGASIHGGNGGLTNTIFVANTVTRTSSQGGGLWLSDPTTIHGGRFERNRAQRGDGGGLFARASVGLSQTTFLSNTADGVGGGYAGGPITITSGVFVSNRAVGGGGISTTLGLVLGSVFTDNRDGFGGGKFIGGGILADRLTVRDTRFISNSMPNGGGAIFANVLTAERDYFEGNQANIGGAAVFISRTGMLSDSTFVRNRISSAVFAQGEGGGTTRVSGSLFDGNVDISFHHVGGGGAIDSEAASLIVEDSNFQNNSSLDGGAIRATGLTVRRSAFFNNRVNANGESGGAISAGKADIGSSSFISNSSNGFRSGGAIYAAEDLTVRDSIFVSNAITSTADGGAIFASGALNVSGSQFRSNRVDKAVTGNSGRGGAIFFNPSDKTASIVDSEFVGNRANHGGALVCRGGCQIATTRFASNVADEPDAGTLSSLGTGGAVFAQGDLSVKRSRFIRNRAGVAGGALYQAHIFNSAGPYFLDVQNSLFSANLARNVSFGSRGNAVFVTGTFGARSGRILFNTIVSETLAPGSALLIRGGPVDVADNIIARQGAAIEHESSGTLSEDFNLFSGNTQNLSGTISSGGSSFTATPVFLAPTLDLYYLLPGSPGIDQGTDTSVVFDDVDGQVRPQGAGFDIGFDEGGPRQARLPLVLR